MDLLGGGSVGDAVAVVLVESVPLTGAAVFSACFTEHFGRCGWHLKCVLFSPYRCRAGDGKQVDGAGIMLRREAIIVTQGFGVFESGYAGFLHRFCKAFEQVL